MVEISARTFNPILWKGEESDIAQASIKKAAIIMSTDTHKFFVDIAQNSRVEISDFIGGYTETQIKAVSAGSVYVNKIYRASDTNHLFVYVSDGNNSYNAVDITNFKVTSATSADYASSASTADMYHADVADSATNAGTATYATNAGTATRATNADTATYANAPKSGSDWDFGNSSEYGSLAALG